MSTDTRAIVRTGLAVATLMPVAFTMIGSRISNMEAEVRSVRTGPGARRDRLDDDIERLDARMRTVEQGFRPSRPAA